MFNGVEYVREICTQRKIPISQLEKDCGFANGYLNPKKLQKIPYDRAKKIAEYLSLSLDYLLNGPVETKKTPALTEKDRRDVAKDVYQIMESLEGSGELMFDGIPMSEESKAAMASAMRVGLEEARRRNKALYTPKKFRKE